ncbi:MAG: vWA domain-containing protein [Pseudomonadota bacterium]
MLKFKWRIPSFVLSFVLALAVFNQDAEANDRAPLILEGTETIYQRVLTRPNAKLMDEINGSEIEALPVFQPFYVFTRQEGWVEVGPSFSGEPKGWISEQQTVLWQQNIVGSFTIPANRNRQLLMNDLGSLEDLINNEAVRDLQERLVSEANAGILSADSNVISIEPENFVNIQDSLYLMPILDFTETFDPVAYNDLLLMEVASLPKEEEVVKVQEDNNNPFDAGIVFLLDTTQSMENYIASTQTVLQGIVQQIAGTEIGELVNFAVIGFRDNVDAVPELEYRTKTLIGMERRDNEAPVIDAIGQAIDVANVSSPGFNEDSLAAVEDAIDSIDWGQKTGDGHPIDARYVILVTDAGPKDPSDINARSKIGAVELQRDAEGKNIVIMTLHLKTDTGSSNHGYAASRYKELSRFAGSSYYFPIENGSEAAFEDVSRRLVTALTDHVRLVRGDDRVQSEEETSVELENLGRAMQLAWLGATEQTQAPDVIRGWVSNMAVEDSSVLAIEPRLLITKNEMSTLAALLENLISFGEQAQSTEEQLDFFGQVRGLIADMAQNPDFVINAEADTLGGALEFIDRLPYQSQVLGMTEDRWAESAMFRRSIIDGMSQKLAQYRRWLFDSGVWTELYEGSPDGEYVFAMPFDVLP